MSTFKLFNIYHSLFIKKWYLFFYVLLLIIVLMSSLIIFHQVKQEERKFTIGIIDNDNSPETRLILKTVGNGKSLGDDLKIKRYSEKEALKLLKKQKINGYLVLNKGMTKAFYKKGELPISVHTYDKQSLQSVAILQLTDSVYSRLMLSPSGFAGSSSKGK